MRVRDINLRSYSDLDSFLGKRWVKKIAHKTYAVRRDGYIEVTLFGHTIVRSYPYHTAIFSCGYKTYTTKQRLNCLIPSRFSIYQHKFEWYVWDRDNDTKFGYHEGMVFDNA